MNDVRMPRQKVLDIMRKNRDQHVEMYNTAFSKWKQDYAQQIQDEADRINGMTLDDWDGKDTFYMTDPRPHSYEDQYTEAIQMLEHDSRNEIVLSRSDYRRYVQDNWDWKENFMTSNSKYLG